MVDRATVDELFDVDIDEFDIIVKLFAEVDEVFDVVVVEVFVVDVMSSGALLTTRN